MPSRCSRWSPTHRYSGARAGMPSDDDLARRFASGDPSVLDDLYARYGGSMLTAALHLVGGDRSLAEEAVHTAVHKAWQAAGTFEAAPAARAVAVRDRAPLRDRRRPPGTPPPHPVRPMRAIRGFVARPLQQYVLLNDYAGGVGAGGSRADQPGESRLRR